MSVDRQYTIKISTVADNSGADKATEALKDSGKAAEKTEISHHVLHQTLELIARQSGPGAAAALSSLAAAGTGSLALVVLAARELFEWLQKIQDKNKEVAEQVAAVWIAQRDAINDAADSARKFQEELGNTKNKADELKGAFEDEKAVLDAQIEGHKKILETLENEQLAEAAGDKDKEEAIKRRFADLNAEYDITAEIAKLEQERQQRAGLKQHQEILSATAEDLEAEKERVIGDKSASAAATRIKGKDEDSLKAAADKAYKFLTADLVTAGVFLQLGRAATPEEAIQGARAGILTGKKEAAALDAFNAYEADAAAVKAHKDAVDLATTKAQEAAAARDKNKDAIDTETQKINSASDVLNVHQKTADTEQRLRDLTAIGGAGNIGAALQQQAQDRLLADHGGKISDAHMQANQALDKFLTDLGFSSQQIQGMIRALADHMGDQRQEVGALKNYVDAAIARLDSDLNAQKFRISGVGK